MENLPKEREVEYVESADFISEDTTSTISFNRNGVEAQNKEQVFAKVLSDTKSKQDFYYALEVNSNLHDPTGPYSSRGSKLDDAKFAKVSKDVFDLYIGYLKTNNSVYLSKAQRGFLNG